MLKMMSEIFREREERERLLTWRYPWFNVVYNWAVAILALALCAALFWWGVDAHYSLIAKNMSETAVEDYKAEQLAAVDAEEEQRRQAEEAAEKIILAEARDAAKALYGIRLFVEKYHYTESDLKTYLWSGFNRADATGKSLHDVLFDGQYLASSESNRVLVEYKSISEDAVREWHADDAKPCDIAFQFAELRPDGIWLKKDIDADAYAPRWRYK